MLTTLADRPTLPGDAPLLLVGRGREQALLHTHLSAALTGRGSLILIGGEAGIGKTALADALCREAAGKGAFVLVGRCYDLTETPPYGPWVELFARYWPDDGPSPPDAFAQRGTVGEATSQAILFQQVQDFLTALAMEQPLVLLLDDLHWADPASFDLLRVLARSTAALPLLILVTYRADELTRHHPLYALLPLLERESGAIRLDLRRLSMDAVRAMVTARYPLSTADSDRLVAYLDTRAEGNAFFTSQLLRALEEGAAIRQEGDGWVVSDLDRIQMPAALRQVIDGRVMRLGGEAQRLLAVAAVIGQEAPFALWSTVTETDEERLLDVVEQATVARIVEATEDGMRFRFVHALIRETLYAGILPMRRRVQHRQIGDILATGPDADPDAVAYHFRQAGDPRTVEWVIRAGERAQQAYARLTAADRFEEALALMEMGGADASERGWLLLRLALLRRYSDFRQALGYLEATERLATEAGDVLLKACTRFTEGLVLCYLEELRRGVVGMEEAVAAFDALFPLDESVLRRLERIGMATDPDNHRGTLALWLATIGALQHARTLSEEIGPRILTAPTTARLDGAFAADAFRALGNVYATLGQPIAAQQAYQRNKDAYRAIGDHLQILTTVRQELLCVTLPYQADDLAEKQRLVTEAVEALTKIRSTTPANLTGWASLPLLVLDGQWREAYRLLTALRANSDAIWAKIFITSLLGPLARQQGNANLARTLVREEFPAGPATSPGAKRYVESLALLRLAALLAFDASDLSIAKEWLEAHDRWLAWNGAVLSQSEGQALWAQYHRATGDAKRAHTHAEQARAHAINPRQPLALLAAHRLLGELDADARRFDDAQTHLERSLTLADACGAPYERALTLLATAELRAATGETEAARSLLDEVRAICEPLGAEPTLARTDALAIRLTAVFVPPATYPDGLSAREVDVLRLIATGLNNQEIAHTLSLSVRTVERHITNLYGKIAARGRADATAYALHHLS